MLIQALWRLPGQVVVFILKQLASNFARCFLKFFLTVTDRLAAVLKEQKNIEKVKEWLEQGRTDAWIAHKLGISGSELIGHKVELGLIEAPVEEIAEDRSIEVLDDAAEPAGSEQPAVTGKPATEYEASFEHGESDGYGLWLDPSVQDDPVYREHWSGRKSVVVSLDVDKITIRPST